MTAQIINDKKRVKELYYMILKNEADIDEYYEYENILKKYYTKERIWRDLNAQGFRKWEDLYAARNPKIKFKPSDDSLAFLLGAVLALAVGLLMAKFLDE